MIGYSTSYSMSTASCALGLCSHDQVPINIFEDPPPPPALHEAWTVIALYLVGGAHMGFATAVVVEKIVIEFPPSHSKCTNKNWRNRDRGVHHPQSTRAAHRNRLRSKAG